MGEPRIARFFDRRRNFQKRVEFKAKNDETSIYLKEGGLTNDENISSSPFSIDALIAMPALAEPIIKIKEKKKRPEDVELPTKAAANIKIGNAKCHM